MFIRSQSFRSLVRPDVIVNSYVINLAKRRGSLETPAAAEPDLLLHVGFSEPNLFLLIIFLPAY